MNITDAPFMQSYMRLTHDAWLKGWHERNGGNLTYRMTAEDVATVEAELKPLTEWLPIGIEVKDLAGEYFLVSGTGRFMRNVIIDPEANIGIIKIDDQGQHYQIMWGLSAGTGRPTSELPSHLKSHELKKQLTQGQNRVIYHAHPTNIIALTFVLPLEDKAFTRELWEMATEDAVVFPEGIGVVKWMVPGGADIARESARLFEKYNLVVWAHHGMFVCGKSFDEAFSNMDTAEKAAEICVKVRSMGGKRQTISADNLRQLARDFKVNLREDFLED